MDHYNYINFKDKFGRIGFAYLDIADSPASYKIMEDKGISRHVKIKSVAHHPEVPYAVILCSIKKRLAPAMHEVMEELERKLLLTGHSDYLDESQKFVSLFGKENADD